MTYQSVPHLCKDCRLTWLFVGDTCDVCRCLPSNTNLSPIKGTLGGGSIAGLKRPCPGCRRHELLPGEECPSCSDNPFLSETQEKAA